MISLDWRERLFGPSNKEEESENSKLEITEQNPLEDDVIWHHGETVKDIVKNISVSKNVTIQDAAKGINAAIDNGKVKIIDPSPPRSFIAYFSSFYNIWFASVIILVFLMVFSIYLLPQTYPYVYLRYVVGGVFVLFIPGYVLIETLYPKAEELDRLERFALDIGLSLAVVPLVGLILNYTPWGIRLEPILLSLSILVLILGILGVWRKYLSHKLITSL
jgi:hypothetical protein